MVWYVGTVRYASIFAKKYGTLVWYVFFVMVRVWYVGTVRLFCKGMGTVCWYALSIKTPDFCTLRWLFVNRGKELLKPTLNVWIEFANL